MGKTSLAIMLAFALLLLGAEHGETAEANFMWIFATVEPVPGTIPPLISVYSPKNNTSYPSDNLTVNLSVETAKLDGWSSFLLGVDYSLDERTVVWVYPEDAENPGPPREMFGTEFNLTSLPLGNHSLTVGAYAVVSTGNPLRKFFIDSNSTIFFTTSFPTPAPVQALFPTPTPEPSATPEAKSQPTTFPATLIVIAPVAISLAVLGLQVYFKKRK